MSVMFRSSKFSQSLRLMALLMLFVIFQKSLVLVQLQADVAILLPQ
jgi:hypothetical protein